MNIIHKANRKRGQHFVLINQGRQPMRSFFGTCTDPGRRFYASLQSRHNTSKKQEEIEAEHSSPSISRNTENVSASRPKPPDMTPREIIDALNSLDSFEGDTQTKRQHRKELLVAGKRAFGIGIYSPAFFKAAGCSPTCISVVTLEPRRSHAPARPPIPFHAWATDESRTNKSNSQLSVHLARLINEDNQELITTEMEAQGFRDVRLLKSKIGGFAMTATRDPGTLANGATSAGATAVIFRGTFTMRELIEDFNAFQVDRSARYGAGLVHKGFDKMLDSLWKGISKDIQDFRKRHPDRPILFSGHSLGGSLATLALARARTEGLLNNPPYTGKGSAAALHTYGNPRVGDAAFANHFSKINRDIPYQRFIYGEDPVAIIPPKSAGYRDISHDNSKVIHHKKGGHTSFLSNEEAANLDFVRQDAKGFVKATRMAGTFLRRLSYHLSDNYHTIAFRPQPERTSLARSPTASQSGPAEGQRKASDEHEEGSNSKGVLGQHVALHSAAGALAGAGYLRRGLAPSERK